MLAFPKENMTGDAMVQAQLEDCFIDALSSEENKQDVLRISLKWYRKLCWQQGPFGQNIYTPFVQITTMFRENQQRATNKWFQIFKCKN